MMLSSANSTIIGYALALGTTKVTVRRRWRRPGLHQGCVLSGLLFNIFSAALLLVIQERISEDLDIQADLVHLKEKSERIGSKMPSDCVCRAVCGMLYITIYVHGVVVTAGVSTYDDDPC